MGTNGSVKPERLDVLPEKEMLVDGKYVIDGSESEYVYATTGTVTTKVALAGPDGVEKVVKSAPNFEGLKDIFVVGKYIVMSNIMSLRGEGDVFSLHVSAELLISPTQKIRQH